MTHLDPSPSPAPLPTAAELAELRRLVDAATVGPWRVRGFEGLTPYTLVNPEMTMNDWRLTCAAVNALPGLLALIARMNDLGSQMSNVCFNLSQERLLGERRRLTLAQLQEAWDALQAEISRKAVDHG